MAKKRSTAKKARPVTEKMLRVILRKKSESLGAACKAAGIAPANYYYHLKQFHSLQI